MQRVDNTDGERDGTHANIDANLYSYYCGASHRVFACTEGEGSDRATKHSNPLCPNQLVMAKSVWGTQKVTDGGGCSAVFQISLRLTNDVFILMPLLQCYNGGKKLVMKLMIKGEFFIYQQSSPNSECSDWLVLKTQMHNFKLWVSFIISCLFKNAAHFAILGVFFRAALITLSTISRATLRFTRTGNDI